MDMFITELNFDDAVSLDYDQALERLVREFQGDAPVSVDVFRLDGDLEVHFLAPLTGVGAYDQTMPPSIALEFERASVVLDRGEFQEALWLDEPGPVGQHRATRFVMSDRHVEIHEP